MQLPIPGLPHLTYCTNIHPGESSADVLRAVEEHVVPVKTRLGVAGAFGVGLRLSGRAAAELDTPGRLDELRDLLARHELYAFTVNAFPHGAFHGERVKEGVYRPDWLEDERVAYTDRVARLLARLLPEGVSGSVSTVPGAFRERARDAGARGEIARRVLAHAAFLFRLREETGRLVELALEPEPCCVLETSADAVAFFEAELFSSTAVAAFVRATGLHAADAERFLRRHLGVCFDACHFAVEHETAADALARLRAAGVRIGKVQVTAALEVELPGAAAEAEPLLRSLERFADGVYLHQVVERRGDHLVRHLDLPDAIAGARASAPPGPSVWRVHFHVPVFERGLGRFASTQPFLIDVLRAARDAPVSEHLEVETYTWDVLPEEHRAGGVDAAIARELAWTLRELGVPT